MVRSLLGTMDVLALNEPVPEPFFAQSEKPDALLPGGRRIAAGLDTRYQELSK